MDKEEIKPYQIKLNHSNEVSSVYLAIQISMLRKDLEISQADAIFYCLLRGVGIQEDISTISKPIDGKSTNLIIPVKYVELIKYLYKSTRTGSISFVKWLEEKIKEGTDAIKKEHSMQEIESIKKSEIEELPFIRTATGIEKLISNKQFAEAISVSVWTAQRRVDVVDWDFALLGDLKLIRIPYSEEEYKQEISEKKIPESVVNRMKIKPGKI